MSKKILSAFTVASVLTVFSSVSASAVDTGITHNWILPVVLISVALLVIVGLIVTKKKKPDNDDGDGNSNPVENTEKEPEENTDSENADE